MIELDVLIFGGGVAGLWSLDRLRRAGYRCVLLESAALGSGQTLQAQGIIHGGGKYALRGVRDFAAVRAIREMPDRWRRHLRGEQEPDLSAAKILSPECHLWLPRGSFVARLQSWGFMSFMAKTGLLATRPERVPPDRWPEALRGSAVAVYSMAEPVVSTGSLLDALAAPHRRFILRYDPAGIEFRDGSVRAGSLDLKPRATVIAAGEGSAALLKRAGVATEVMQRRPLCMYLLRGNLPPLFGHCVTGGKTRLTVTTAGDVWQIGGEVAERTAEKPDLRLAADELRRWLPGLDLRGKEIASYRAVRAEASTREQKRPSGVHVGAVRPGLWAAWPTKLALAPVLADELLAGLSMELKQPAGYDDPQLPSAPAAPVASYPWESAQWFPAV